MKLPAVTFGFVLLGGCLSATAAEPGMRPREQDRSRKVENVEDPLLERFSLPKAAGYLDRGAHAHEDHCFACHATYAYLPARAVSGAPAAVYRETRQAVEQSAAKLADAKLSPNDKPGRVAEVVMTAAVLAQHDAAIAGKLHPATRTALDRIWDLQRADGGWDWIKSGNPPSEIDDHFGVTMAVIGVAAAPDGYAATPRARKGLEAARRWLRAHPPASMHQRGMLLLAAAHVGGLVGDQEIKQTIHDLVALQRPDGGWSMAALGDWKRADGAPLDRNASDGYGTGFAVYVLRRGAALPASDPRLQGAVAWLKTHQRASGCWFTRSPHKNDELSTYVGTAYAILALDACEALAGG
jgi:squalene-hopene/tetraprenyl-beta-curcumene cyclase